MKKARAVLAEKRAAVAAGSLAEKRRKASGE